jgi:hypothetical protein
MSISESEQFNLLDQLAEEFAERFRRGERPARSEYTRRYPNILTWDQLLALMGELRMMARRGRHAAEVILAALWAQEYCQWEPDVGPMCFMGISTDPDRRQRDTNFRAICRQCFVSSFES